MTHIDDLANDIRAFDGNHELGAAELAEKLVQAGWVRLAPVIDATKLDSGTRVEVLLQGTWTPGVLTEIGPSGLLDVSTERGPWSGYAKGSRVRLPQ